MGHQSGEFEGTPYNNVKISDGLRIIKVKNETGSDNFNSLTPEKTRVECEFNLKSNKEVSFVTLKSIKELK